MADWFTENEPRSSGKDWFAENAPAAPKPAESYAVGNYARGLGNSINPIPMVKGMADAVAHPIDTLKSMGNAQGQVGEKAIESFKRGDYLEGVRHAIGYLLPVIGPQIDAMGDKAQGGQVAEAMGEATGFGIVNALPGSPLAKNVGKRVANIRLPQNPNAVEAAAVKFGQDNGIPVSAGVATGNKSISSLQAVADHSPRGSFIAQKARAKEVEGFRKVGDELAGRVHKSPITPTQAGEGVLNKVEGRISKYHAEANDAYGKIRQFEADPANKRTVQVGTRTETSSVIGADGKPITREVPVTEDIALPVDLREAKAALQPVYDKMVRQLPVTQQRASAGLKAIENILDGPDYAPLSQVDTDLGTIKGIARGADLPELKNMSQGLAAHAVQKLHDAVDSAAAAAGPEVTAALDAGRKATFAKYDAADILKQLRSEPRQVFDQAIWSHDSGIEKLRQVQRLAPQEMPKIGRAYLQELLEKAEAEGGFDKTRTMHSQWQNLGPQTKKVLFKNPMLIKDLDNFFLLAKKAAESPNPSGSALVGSLVAGTGYLFTHPVRGTALFITGAALSRLLHSPRAVKALTNGLTVPVGKGARSAMAAEQILKIAGDQAKPLPLAAETDSDPVIRSAKN